MMIKVSCCVNDCCCYPLSPLWKRERKKCHNSPTTFCFFLYLLFALFCYICTNKRKEDKCYMLLEPADLILKYGIR